MTVIRRFSDLDWRFLLLILPAFFLLVYICVSSIPISTFPTAFAPVASFFFNWTTADSSSPPPVYELDGRKIAVCLVGGARRFELTGPSIVESVLKVYPNADLFLHSPLDKNSFKFSLLKIAPRIAAIRIFKPRNINETEAEVRVLTSAGSPNGIQGLLQYFNLVEGCLTLIQEHQKQNQFIYDWIIRTRVDGYWNAPLHPSNFIPGHYLIPPGSNYGGLNDRLGIGDYNSTVVALSRLSLIPKLDSIGYRNLNSETSFRAQLTSHGIYYKARRLPFCIVSDRRYVFPPGQYGVPVAALSSPGPLSGAKCRPCTPICEGKCVRETMSVLDKGWSWTDWENGSLDLCNAQDEWEEGWEKIFDRVAGKKRAAVRKRIRDLKMKECVADFNEMRWRTFRWDSPPADEICKLGLEKSN
ncbi:uncharacterized protein [Euphorbia lathyris]|uniref:uncharacterized protein n=1 Tax=Euphorbia lathyris TaxID=212925 RepID=UPI0033137BDE